MKEIYSIACKFLYKDWYKYTNYHNYVETVRVRIFDMITHRIAFEYVSRFFMIDDHLYLHFSRNSDYFEFAEGNNEIATIPEQVFGNICRESENHLYLIRFLLSHNHMLDDSIYSTIYTAINFGGHISHIKELLLLGTNSSIHKKYVDKIILDDDFLSASSYDYKLLKMMLSIGTDYGKIFERDKKLNELCKNERGLTTIINCKNYDSRENGNRFMNLIKKYRK